MKPRNRHSREKRSQRRPLWKLRHALLQDLKKADGLRDKLMKKDRWKKTQVSAGESTKSWQSAALQLAAQLTTQHQRVRISRQKRQSCILVSFSELGIFSFHFHFHIFTLDSFLPDAFDDDANLFSQQIHWWWCEKFQFSSGSFQKIHWWILLLWLCPAANSSAQLPDAK